LDFIDDNFGKSKEELSWDGEVDGIPTNISIKLPLQETVYAAWEQLPSSGHCHGHVWWTMPVPLPSPVITPAPPGFEAIFAITGILAVVYLLRKRE
jgi:PGF-CTERM protein